MTTRARDDREKLQGWIPALATPQEIRQALEKALDYRGDVTLTLKNGERIEGYLFDRHSEGPELARCFVRLLPRERNEKVLVRYSEIARLEFSGRDMAEGKNFETWIKNYQEKKSRGEKNITLEPEALD